MKILHVVHAFPPEVLPGGTERVVTALAAGMRTAGHEVVVAAGSLQLRSGPRVVEETIDLDGAALRVLRLPRSDLHFESWEKAWSPDLGNAFRRVLKDERPDVVHVHHWLRLTSDLLRIARQEQVPVVACTLHDYWSQLVDPARLWGLDVAEAPPAPPWMNQAERDEAFSIHRLDMLDEIRAADLRFAPSRAQADGLRQLAGADLGEILVAPPPLLQRPAPRAVTAEPRGKRLLCWGSIYPAKGLDVVFDALFSVQGGYELHVFGEAHDADYGDRLRRRAERMPVHFHGAFTADDLVAAPGDYAVLPSACHESYGLVLDEARCLGLPVLASDLPAFREHCDPAATAFFEPGDPGSLAMLLLDEARLHALQPSTPPREFGGSEAAAQLLDCYQAAVDGQHGPVDAPRALGDRRRAALLFRRAERRLWSALQQGTPSAPPENFL